LKSAGMCSGSIICLSSIRFLSVFIHSVSDFNSIGDPFHVMRVCNIIICNIMLLHIVVLCGMIG